MGIGPTISHKTRPNFGGLKRIVGWANPIGRLGPLPKKQNPWISQKINKDWDRKRNQ